jgi:hypothetical protein
MNNQFLYYPDNPTKEFVVTPLPNYRKESIMDCPYVTYIKKQEISGIRYEKDSFYSYYTQNYYLKYTDDDVDKIELNFLKLSLDDQRTELILLLKMIYYNLGSSNVQSYDDAELLRQYKRCTSYFQKENDNVAEYEKAVNNFLDMSTNNKKNTILAFFMVLENTIEKDLSIISKEDNNQYIYIYKKALRYIFYGKIDKSSFSIRKNKVCEITKDEDDINTLETSNEFYDDPDYECSDDEIEQTNISTTWNLARDIFIFSGGFLTGLGSLAYFIYKGAIKNMKVNN